MPQTAHIEERTAGRQSVTWLVPQEPLRPLLLLIASEWQPLNLKQLQVDGNCAKGEAPLRRSAEQQTPENAGLAISEVINIFLMHLKNTFILFPIGCMRLVYIKGCGPARREALRQGGFGYIGYWRRKSLHILPFRLELCKYDSLAPTFLQVVQSNQANLRLAVVAAFWRREL